MRFEISHQADVAQETWDGLVNSSDDTWLWHLWAWTGALARVYPVEKQYFICRVGGRDVGGLQFLLRQNTGSVLGPRYSLMSIPAGPFCVSGVSNKTRTRVVAELTAAAMSWAREVGLRTLSCMLPPLAMSNLQNIHGVNPLIAAGWRDASTHTLIADLSKSESDLWLDLAHDARWQVKKARSAGYVVQRAKWREMLDSYYGIHVENYERTGVPPHPKSYFEAIAQTEDKHQSVLWVGRTASGRPVAFHNCARFRNGSVYNTGCCETEHLRSGINYLLFWNAILGAKHDRCRFYEIGEVFPDARTGKLKGLTTFKEKFGGELYRFYRGQIPIAKPRFVSLATRILPRPLRRYATRYIEGICRSFPPE